MDIYGIGSALRGMFGVVSEGARRSGRTSRMLDLVRSGDVILCLSTREAEGLRKELKRREISDVRVIDKKAFYEGAGRANARRDIGRVHFTHEFVEDHYHYALHRADESLRDIELILYRRPTPPPGPPPLREVRYW
ncbi:hypothetical protein DN730_09800 [Marinomonas piezotolerans]|uniref:Uncharacterized protein n=1 Tax=Marinomonas piezotolerans TaxID=2213058 RepID=A0A370UA56_9GAMM|nr:hypothetical protein [Marinomonas piezotolerans]RDL44669.1 hypothetical protein DN730_09800 [Marinomonas piezotolerans]